MHPEAFTYVASAAAVMNPAKVLEIGSRDINGSVRPIFSGADYTGIDIAPGPGVDVVTDATTWKRSGFDVVVCCEVLEHTAKGKAIIATAARALKVGGTLIATCATDPRAPHSAADGGQVGPDEFYRNVSPALMSRWLTAAGFTVTDRQIHVDRGDLYVTATR